MAIRLRDLVNDVVSKTRDADPQILFEHSKLTKTGLFYGASGIAYLLTEASRAIRDPALIRDADRFCRFAEANANSPPAGQPPHSVPKPLLNAGSSIAAGSGGVGYTKALLAAGMDIPGGVKAGIDMFAEAWIGSDALGDDLSPELHFGAAGFTCAATDLLERLGDLAPSERERLEVVQKQSVKRLTASLEQPFTGRSDGVGMAHGVAGPLYACLRASVAPDLVARRTYELIDLAIDQPPLIQWPSTLDTRQLDDFPVSMCRGLSGVLTLLCEAARRLRSERIGGFAARAASMLRKLPSGASGICCGAAGQAIAVNHFAALSGCTTSRRWARSRLRLAAEDSSPGLPADLWYGRPGVALAALTLSGKGALPLLARP